MNIEGARGLRAWTWRAALAISFVGAACGGEINDTQPTVPNLTFAATAPPIPPEIAPTPVGSEFINYQALLESSGFVLNSRKEIMPNDGVPATIMNFTANTINTQAVAGIIDKYNGITHSDNKLEYPYIDGYTHVVPLPLETFFLPSQRIIFFVPDNAPFPDTSSIANGIPTADLPAYTLLGDNGALYSVVRAGAKHKYVEYASEEESASVFFAIELCQQTMFAAVTNSEGDITFVNPHEFGFPQELLCNSFGEAAGFATLGRSFQEYVAEINNRNIEGSPPIGLDEASYNDLPKLGSVIQ